VGRRLIGARRGRDTQETHAALERQHRAAPSAWAKAFELHVAGRTNRRRWAMRGLLPRF